MLTGILGKKIGMTRIFTDGGKAVPVTVIEAGPCRISQIKNETSDGYHAIQLCFDPKKENKTNKPELGHFKKAKIAPAKIIKEILISKEELGKHNLGDEICLDIFKEGDFVDISGVSIGRGFQGGVKRWHWKGGKKTHGSMQHRTPGSIGASSDPSRVFKGQHLPGHMGSENKTIQSLKVVGVDKENSLLTIKGSVPGHKNAYVVINKAKKRASQAVAREEGAKEEPENAKQKPEEARQKDKK